MFSNSKFDYSVHKPARNLAQGASGGRAPPLKDALREVARDLRARLRTNVEVKFRIAVLWCRCWGAYCPTVIVQGERSVWRLSGLRSQISRIEQRDKLEWRYLVDALLPDPSQPALERFRLGAGYGLNESEKSFYVPAEYLLESTLRGNLQGKGGAICPPLLKSSATEGSRRRISLR